jgi:hypothetical protein
LFNLFFWQNAKFLVASIITIYFTKKIQKDAISGSFLGNKKNQNRIKPPYPLFSSGKESFITSFGFPFFKSKGMDSLWEAEN